MSTILGLDNTILSRRLKVWRGFTILIVVTFQLLAPTEASAVQVRIKDLVNVGGVRGNDLVGYGLVVGLNGSGDGLRNSPFTEEAMTSLLERLGINVAGEQFRPKNVAAVLVTAVLPAFARNGSQIDVTVSAIGDSKSLLGGTLIMTPLNAADGQIYAVAQGSIIAGGIAVEGDAKAVTQGVPTSGTIPSGARIEREIDFSLNSSNELILAVREPDFTTAARIEKAINSYFGVDLAELIDSGTIKVNVSVASFPSTSHLLSDLENIEISPAQKARVVVDHRSGTIVLGSDVKISRVAVAQGNLTLSVEERPNVVSVNPFFPELDAITVPRTDIAIGEEEVTDGLVVVEESVSLKEVVSGLNALGVGPRDTIDILKAIKSAGALHAEFLVQ